jgi:tetratricopeptide (TPR) repeat protein
MGDYLRAIDDFDQAIALGLETAAVYNQRASVYRELGRYAEARQDLQKAIELNPYYGMLFSNMGELIGIQDPTDRAQLAYYDRAIQEDHTYPHAYRNRANYYRLTGDYSDHVINDYTTAFRLLPANLNILWDRAYTFHLRGEIVRARTDFNTLIEQDPTHTDAYIGRAQGYYALGDVRLAVDDLLTAIRLDPQSEFAYYNLGVYLYREQQYLAALYAYNKTLEINPDHGSALFNRSQVYENIAGFDELELMAYSSIEAIITPIP